MQRTGSFFFLASPNCDLTPPLFDILHNILHCSLLVFGIALSHQAPLFISPTQLSLHSFSVLNLLFQINIIVNFYCSSSTSSLTISYTLFSSYNFQVNVIMAKLRYLHHLNISQIYPSPLHAKCAMLSLHSVHFKFIYSKMYPCLFEYFTRGRQIVNSFCQRVKVMRFEIF